MYSALHTFSWSHIYFFKAAAYTSDNSETAVNQFFYVFQLSDRKSRAVARTLIGGCIFIYSGSARLVSFEIKLISKEVSRAQPEYMNIHRPN